MLRLAQDNPLKESSLTLSSVVPRLKGRWLRQPIACATPGRFRRSVRRTIHRGRFSMAHFIKCNAVRSIERVDFGRPHSWSRKRAREVCRSALGPDVFLTSQAPHPGDYRVAAQRRGPSDVPATPASRGRRSTFRATRRSSQFHFEPTRFGSEPAAFVDRT